MIAPPGPPARLVVLSAGLGDPSSTRMLADRLAAATVAQLGGRGAPAKVDVIELREHAHDVMTRLVTDFPSPQLDDVVAAVTGADGLIAVTPVYTTSYSGLFKSFVDVLEPAVLAGVPVLIGATGGTERHLLALDYAIRPLFAYLRATVVPTGVYAATGDWGAGAAEAALTRRTERAGAELAALVASAPRGARRAADPFALPAGFDPSGLRAAGATS